MKFLLGFANWLRQDFNRSLIIHFHTCDNFISFWPCFVCPSKLMLFFLMKKLVFIQYLFKKGRNNYKCYLPFSLMLPSPSQMLPLLFAKLPSFLQMLPSSSLVLPSFSLMLPSLSTMLPLLFIMLPSFFVKFEVGNDAVPLF